MKWNSARSSLVDFIAGEGSLRRTLHAPLGSAMHFHSVAIATQPEHRLQIRPIVHN